MLTSAQPYSPKYLTSQTEKLPCLIFAPKPAPLPLFSVAEKNKNNGYLLYIDYVSGNVLNALNVLFMCSYNNSMRILFLIDILQRRKRKCKDTAGSVSEGIESRHTGCLSHTLDHFTTLPLSDLRTMLLTKTYII